MNKVIFLLTVLGLLFAGCENDSEYDEISTMIIASKKLEGITFSCGMNIKQDVFAIKENVNTTWSGFGNEIYDFDYQEGNEYVITVGTKHCYDPNMGQPAWDEFYLVKLISQTKTDSEGLPENFIPDWWEE